MKKLINRVEDVLSEQLAGLAKAHPELRLHQDPVYVTRADAPVAGKVALLSGGGSGIWPIALRISSTLRASSNATSNSASWRADHACRRHRRGRSRRLLRWHRRST